MFQKSYGYGSVFVFVSVNVPDILRFKFSFLICICRCPETPWYFSVFLHETVIIYDLYNLSTWFKSIFLENIFIVICIYIFFIFFILMEMSVDLKKSREPKLPGCEIFCICTQLLCCSSPTPKKFFQPISKWTVINVWRTAVLYELSWDRISIVWAMIFLDIPGFFEPRPLGCPIP